MGIERLEERTLMSVTIQIDYSLDANNFFDTQAKKDLLQLAANNLASHLNDSLAAITPGGGNHWNMVIVNPATGDQQSLSDPSIAADTVLVFAGGRDLSGGGELGVGGPAGFNASGSQNFLNIVTARGEAGALLATPTDFGSPGGTVTFSTTANWFFGADDSAQTNSQNDFLSVAEHELGHLLGFGTAESWTSLVDGNGDFTGAASAAENGGDLVPVSPDGGHFASGTFSGGQEVAMSPTLTTGTRKLFTPLDFAGLDDLGWDVVNDFTAPTAVAAAIPTLTVGGAATVNFTVTYADAVAVKASTFDDNDVRVTGPGGFDQLASFVIADAAGDGTSRTVTYSIAAPGGAWNATYNGTYTLSLEGSQVSDGAGNFIDAKTLTTLVVNIAAVEVDVQGQGVSIADGDTTPSATDDTDFGVSLLAGQQVAHTFTIRNTGGDALTLSGSPRVAISGANAADFTVTTQPATGSISGGGSTTFVVTFDPSAIGLRTATVTILSDDANEATYNFNVQGLGVAPEIDVVGNGVSIASGDSSPGVADFTDFANMGVSPTGGATPSSTRTYTIRNTGAGLLSLGGAPLVSISGANAADFSVTTPPASSVSGGLTTTFTITFNPSAAGLRTALVTIADSDADEGTYTFAIQGTGLTTTTGTVVGIDKDMQSATTVAGTGSGAFAGNILTVDYTGYLLDGTIFDSSLDAGRTPFTFQLSTANISRSVIEGWDSGLIGAKVGEHRTLIIPSALAYGSNPPQGIPSNAVLIFDIVVNAIVFPDINVAFGNVNLTDGDTTPAAADGTDFGALNIGVSGAARTFTLSNTTSASLSLVGSTPVTITGAGAADFVVSAVAFANGQATFTVQFKPLTAGLRAATVHVASTDPDENPFDFDVQGQGGPIISVAAPDAVAQEPAFGLDTAQFTITSSLANPSAQTVNFTLSGSAALGRFTFSAVGGTLGAIDPSTGVGTLTLNAGVTSATILATPVNDSVAQPDQSLSLTLNAGSDYTRDPVAANTVATITLKDDEPTVSVVLDDGNAAEPTGQSVDNGAFHLHFVGDKSAAHVVNFTLGGSAARSRYNLTSPDGTIAFDPVSGVGTFTVNAGVTNAAVAVVPIDDALAQGDQAMVFTINAGSGYTPAAAPDDSGSVLIADNEPVVTLVAGVAVGSETGPTASTVTLHLVGDLGVGRVVNFTLSGTALLTDYVVSASLGVLGAIDASTKKGSVAVPANTSNVTLIFTPVDDTTPEDAETVVVTVDPSSAYSLAGGSQQQTMTIDDNDRSLSLKLSKPSFLETGGPKASLLTITRNGPATADVTVNLTSSDTGAATLPVQVVIPHGKMSVTVPVAAVDDQSIDGTEHATLTATDADGKFLAASIVAAVTDNERPTITMTAIQAHASETGTPGEIQFTRNGATTADLFVKFTVAGVAKRGPKGDFIVKDSGGAVLTKLTVKVPAGSASASVFIVPNADSLAEPLETLGVKLAPAANYIVGSLVPLVLDIADNAPTVSVSVTDAAAAKPGDDTGTIRLSLNHAVAVDTLVKYKVTGTAKAGVDYVSLGTSAVIPAGQTSVDLVVQPIGSGVLDRTLILTVAADKSYFFDGAANSGTVAIAAGAAIPGVDLLALAATISTKPLSLTSLKPATITISRTIRNQGDTIAGAFTVQSLFSADRPLGGDLDAGSVSVAAGLAPGKSITIKQTITQAQLLALGLTADDIGHYFLLTLITPTGFTDALTGNDLFVSNLDSISIVA
jgi:hypothetical protein